jgi:excisionase family DNA binding protein
MERTSSTTFEGLIPGGLPTLTGQGANQFPAFNPAPAPKLERLWTVPEVCEYLRIGERGVYRAISESRLLASWVGRQHLVSESDLARFVENQKAETSWHQKARETAKEAN